MVNGGTFVLICTLGGALIGGLVGLVIFLVKNKK